MFPVELVQCARYKDSDLTLLERRLLQEDLSPEALCHRISFSRFDMCLVAILVTDWISACVSMYCCVISTHACQPHSYRFRAYRSD